MSRAGRVPVAARGTRKGGGEAEAESSGRTVVQSCILGDRPGFVVYRDTEIVSFDSFVVLCVYTRDWLGVVEVELKEEL